MEELQVDVERWIETYNEQRPHSGKYCYGKTPMQTFREAKHLALEKKIPSAEFGRECQIFCASGFSHKDPLPRKREAVIKKN